MQNVNQFLTEQTFMQQIDKQNAALAALLMAKNGSIKPSSWESVQRIVRDGLASKVFAIGDQLTCQRDGVNLVWDIIGIDHDTPTDPQFTHSLTLQLHYCFPTPMQFDAPEAFYYCGSALEAKTYYFTVNGTDYQFTLDSDVAAGGQLILNFTGNTPTSIKVAGTKGGAVSDGSIAVTAGSGGDKLMGVNNIDRVRYGSNNYKKSAIRQWLNSSAAAGSVWTPQTKFDRPPEWHTGNKAIAGFLNGMDNDFLEVLGDVTKVTTRNTVADGGGYDTTTEKFFLLSRSEIYGGAEVSGVNEGAAYPYYSDYSGLSAAGMGSDSNRIKYRDGTPYQWWLRTPNIENDSEVRAIHAHGELSGPWPFRDRDVVPACNII